MFNKDNRKTNSNFSKINSNSFNKLKIFQFNREINNNIKKMIIKAKILRGLKADQLQIKIKISLGQWLEWINNK